MTQLIVPPIDEDDRLLTFRQFVAERPEHCEGSLRWQWHNRERNGLATSGAIVSINSSGGKRGQLRLIPRLYRKWQLARGSAA